MIEEEKEPYEKPANNLIIIKRNTVESDYSSFSLNSSAKNGGKFVMPDMKYNNYGYTPKMPKICDVPALGNKDSYDSEDDGIS